MTTRKKRVMGSQGARGAKVAHRERRRAAAESHEALRESEERHRAFFEQAADTIVVIDPKTLSIVEFNDEACRHLGYTREEFARLKISDIEVVESPTEIRRHAAKVATVPLEVFETKQRTKAGKVLDIEVRAKSVRVHGRLLTQAVWRDITERKQAERALRVSETRLAQAVRVAGLGTFEHDHVSDIIEYSPLMRQIMGFAESEEITITAIVARVIATDRDAMAAAIRRAHDPAGDGSFEVEYRVADPEGRVRWLSARSQTFFEGKGSKRRPVRTIGAALDVTGRMEIQAELERLVAERTARLQEMVSDLEHFSYTITHDMRAPLRAMIGYGEVITELCAECGRPEQKEFIRRIMTSAERMDALIRDALNFSRAVRQELPLEEVDTGALLRGMLDSYPELQPSKARIRVEGKLPVVLGNEAGLTQCFSNLLGNAVKFVEPGSLPEIRVWAEERDGQARVWVEDKGIGIVEELLPRVFEMFSQGSRKYGGTGIGLALVRKVICRMGGEVGVESEEGKGSRFWLELRSARSGIRGKRYSRLLGLKSEELPETRAEVKLRSTP